MSAEADLPLTPLGQTLRPVEKVMIRNVISSGVLSFLLCGNVFAEFSIYTIDQRFEAVFPATPQFTGEVGEGEQKHKSYNYTDEGNLIIYTATYQVGRKIFSERDISNALSNYVKGQALVVGGSVETYSNKIINGNDSAVFIVTYQLRGVPVRKYGVVSYKSGYFYQWAVQEFPRMSTLSGENIFKRYLAYFSVR